MMVTIKELISLLSQGECFNLYCSVFLDSFYSANNKERSEMIRDEPEHYDNVDHFYYCDVAAIAHKLANDYGVCVPDWVHKEKYKLDEPHYDLNTKNEALRKYLEEVSPYEFKIRNIYVDTNTLDRV
jgi:hypothetical protein